jgi:hypothetical protein
MIILHSLLGGFAYLFTTSSQFRLGLPSKMASPKMWRYLEFFFDNLTVPHYFVTYNKTSKTTKRVAKENWSFSVLYMVFAYVHCVLLIYYQSKYALFSATGDISVTQKSLLSIFVMLFTSIMVLINASVYTIAFKDPGYAEALTGVCLFQPNFEGR